PRLAARPASTRNQLLAVRVVVVGQFLSWSDVAGRSDPDRGADDLAVTVRTTRVIDEARQVPAHVRIAYPAAIHREAPDAALLQILRLAFQAFFVIDQLAGVIDNPRVFRDWLCGEDSPSMDAGSSPHDFREVGVIHHLFREDNRRISSTDPNRDQRVTRQRFLLNAFAWRTGRNGLRLHLLR